jgi:hypothetical protein
MLYPVQKNERFWKEENELVYLRLLRSFKI